ncbi:G-protein coupled receptor Mth2 isoform X1 [Halictus rubicundus]|uniref:G-protein coupled receptor Mth2 isoform X1 n=1 Tax=Halictus rubicundus TaxID=77578 RepID=UPI004035272C
MRSGRQIRKARDNKQSVREYATIKMLTRAHPGSRTVFAMRAVSVISMLLVRAISLECTPMGDSTGNGSYGTYRIGRNNVGVQRSVANRDTPLVTLCCPLGNRLTQTGCERVAKNTSDHGNGVRVRFPALYRSEGTFELLDESPSVETFRFVVVNFCDTGTRYSLSPEDFPEDEYKLLDNGTIYRPPNDILLNQTDYCLGRFYLDKYEVLLCGDALSEEPPTNVKFGVPYGMILSCPFLLLTFLVYTVVPELGNMHGRTLRGYVGALLVSYMLSAVVQMMPQHGVSDNVCIAFAFIIQFSFLASFFWLNVMCFDIWWTFGGFRSLQGSVKQRERKKFVIYSIYAWGCASILTSVCAIMDFLPSVPDHFIRPQFGEQSCWFKTDEAKAIYFYVPMGVTVVCNICLFISTALKIVQHKKDTANHLKGVDSRRHDDNKQWFNLYLKLFIVMGINWSMEIVSWLCHNTPTYIWYLTDLTNTLQGVIIFLIFVWKEKIRQLLLKRFRCRGRNVLSRNSTRSAYHSSASRTCTTNSTISTQALPLSATGITTAPAASTLFQEKYNPYSSNAPLRTDNKTLSNDSNDCP